VTRLTRWLAVALVAALAVAGWLGWQQARWRQLYYADVTGQVIYDVDMARRALVRASETSDYEQKREAMANAASYVESAYNGSIALFGRMAPFRKGRPSYMPAHYVPAVFEYVRQLTPDLPDTAVQKRIDLLDGLEKALKAGQTETWVPPTQAYRVDVPRLKQSLDEFFRTIPRGGEPSAMLRFSDDPNRPTVTATRHGSDVVELRVDWSQRWQVFPPFLPGYFVLVRPGAGAQVSSDAGSQPRMGSGPLAPFELVQWSAELHDGFKNRLAADWGYGSYTVIRIPEGLPQTLTFRLPEGTEPSLWLLRPGSGELAEPIPVR